MVGIRQPDIGANFTSPFVAADVAFRPNEFTGTITDDFASVPWCNTDFGDYDTTATDHLSRVNDPNTGIGDICRHMGEVDGSQWRIPTAAEIAELYGSNQPNGGRDTILEPKEWIEGNYYQLRGCAFGAGQNYVSITYGDADTDARVNNADPWINGAVLLTPCGLRDAGGSLVFLGSTGIYWSSTASIANDGCRIVFGLTGVSPKNEFHRTQACSIRCIRE